MPLLMTPMTIDAQEEKVTLYLETDEAYYRYGDAGKLYITVWNKATGPIEIENITVTLPWFLLEGRETETIDDIEDAALSANETSEPFTVSFTIPTKGQKWYGSSIEVEVNYLLGEELEHEYEAIGIRIDQLATQSEILTPIYYATIAIIILLILTLLELTMLWRSLRKLAQAPPAAPATQ